MHAAVASQVDPGAPPHHPPGRPAQRRALGQRDRGLRLRPACRLAVSAQPAEGPGRADSSRRARGRCVSSASRSTPASSGSWSRPRSRRSRLAEGVREAAPRRGRLDRSRRPEPDALRALEDDRRAGGLGPGQASAARRTGSPSSTRAPSSARFCTTTSPTRSRRSSGCSTACRACPGSASTSSTCAMSPTLRSGR